MRDNHEGMPEIIDAFEKEGLYFGVVEITLGEICKQFQFGVSLNGYRALRKILQLRRSDSLPGLEHRHFFARSYGKIPDSSDYKVDIRIEQGKYGKKIEARVPKDLLANLVWFSEIRDFTEAAHLPTVN
jgi:hypothetical protein